MATSHIASPHVVPGELPVLPLEGKNLQEMTDDELLASIKPWGKKKLTKEQCALLRITGDWKNLTVEEQIKASDRMFELYPDAVFPETHAKDLEILRERMCLHRPRIMTVFLADITGSRAQVLDIGNRITHLAEKDLVKIPGINQEELHEMLEIAKASWVDNYRAKRS